MKKIYTYKTNNYVVSKIIDNCLKEMYELSYPEQSYDEILEHFREYLNKDTGRADFKVGNTVYNWPYDFFYIPINMQSTIIDNYAEVYNLNSHWKEYVDTVIEYLKNAYNESVKVVYKKDSYGFSHKEYENVDSLEKTIGKESSNKTFELIDYCRNFYRFGEYKESSFRTGVSFRAPSSNKQDVIKAWKDVFDVDIKIPDDKTWVDNFDEN